MVRAVKKTNKLTGSCASYVYLAPDQNQWLEPWRTDQTFKTNNDTIYKSGFWIENMLEHMRILILKLEEADSWPLQQFWKQHW